MTAMEAYSQYPPGLLLSSLKSSPLLLGSEGLSLGSTYPSESSKDVTPRPATKRMKRPHTKSRGGCFNCKRRRVKCPETRPACANCIHKGYDCVYPGEQNYGMVERIQRQSVSDSSRGVSPLPVQIPTTPFTGDDLRFWHHFLVHARPHLPFGDEASWLSTVPAMAHECPHLLHAMLSLGASHCSVITPAGKQYSTVAIAHRGKALQALSTILSKDDCTVIEMDQALATCYTLTFQAHHMSDGVVDFAVMVRGCGLVTDWYFQKGKPSQTFNLQSPEEMSAMITSWLLPDLQPLLDPDVVRACIASLDSLYPLLQSPAHHTFYQALQESYASLFISQRHAFIQLTKIYLAWKDMDNLEFMTFIAPGNHTSRALFMHYIVIDAFMNPAYAELARERNLKMGGGQFLIYRWAEAVYVELPEEYKRLVDDVLEYLAIYMLPEVERHMDNHPQWNHEVVRFVKWLKQRVPSELLGLYNI